MLSEGRSDDGLGLIELVVAIFVSTVVLAGIAAVLVNSWLTQSDVLSTSEATNRGQLMSSSIERAVRNALSFEVLGDDDELRVATTFDDPVNNDPRTCQAFSLADGKAQLKMEPPDLDTVKWSALESVGWATWIDDADQGWVVRVKPVGTHPIFVRNGQTLTYAFEIETDSAPVVFQGEVWMRSTGVVPSC